MEILLSAKGISKSFQGKKLEITVKEEKIQSFLRLGLHYDLLYNQQYYLIIIIKSCFSRMMNFH